jgi:hypothetical protein
MLAGQAVRRLCGGTGRPRWSEWKLRETKPRVRRRARAKEPDTQLATEGSGPLLQRDYVAAIEGGACTPEQIRDMMLRDFARFSPEELAKFEYRDTTQEPLGVDDTMGIDIKGAGYCEVRITHVDDHSLTMRTLEGHPEAGRITMGAYRDAKGDLIFRIRSRARASGVLQQIGYELFGKGLQTRIWVTFCERIAEACGGMIRGEVAVNTEEVEEEAPDLGYSDAPTFATP